MDQEVNRNIVKKLRINAEIKAKEVRLVGDKGEQLGVMPLYQAREVAKNQSLDLVEVAPTATPPVCRLLDYGKYKYEQAKKEREAKKNQKVSLLREVRLRPKIGDHDFDSKSRLTKKLIDGGDKVKVSILFRGREITHPELGLRLLQRMSESVADVAVVEGRPSMEGRRMNVVLIPSSESKPKAESKPKTENKPRTESKPKAESKPAADSEKRTEKIKEEVKES